MSLLLLLSQAAGKAPTAMAALAGAGCFLGDINFRGDKIPYILGTRGFAGAGKGCPSD